MKLPYILPKSKLEWIAWILLFLLLVLVVFFAFFGDAPEEMAWWHLALFVSVVSIGLGSIIYLTFGLIFSIRKQSVRNVILCIVLASILFGAFFAFDYFDGDSSYTSESSFNPEDLFRWGEEPKEPIKPSPAPSTPLVDFNRFNWAPLTSVLTLFGLIGFFLYAKSIYLIHDHARNNRRNVVRWTTASIVFSPLLAGLVYLLTWPEKRRR